jgi:hypothetical protein
MWDRNMKIILRPLGYGWYVISRRDCCKVLRFNRMGYWPLSEIRVALPNGVRVWLRRHIAGNNEWKVQAHIDDDIADKCKPINDQYNNRLYECVGV